MRIKFIGIFFLLISLSNVSASECLNAEIDDYDGTNFWAIKAIQENDIEKIRLEIASGYDVNAPICAVGRSYNYYLITVAAEENKLEILKLLVESGADIQKKGITLYGEGCRGGCTDYNALYHI